MHFSAMILFYFWWEILGENQSCHREMLHFFWQAWCPSIWPTALLQGLVPQKNKSLLQGHGLHINDPFAGHCIFLYWWPETTAAQDLAFGLNPLVPLLPPFWPLVSEASSFTVSVEAAAAVDAAAPSFFTSTGEASAGSTVFFGLVLSSFALSSDAVSPEEDLELLLLL